VRVRRILVAGIVMALAAAFVSPALAGAVVTAVETPAPAASPAPVLLVRSYGTEPDDVLLGERFTLSLTIRNATKIRAKDVVVSLGATSAGSGEAAGGSGGAAELVSLDSSDMRFLGDIKGGGALSVSFNLITSPGAAAGVLSLPVNISSDVNGVRESSSQKIGLRLNRTATLEEQAPDFPKTATEGEEIPITADILNSSSFAVPGVVLSVEGKGFDISGMPVRAGKIEAGESGTVEAKVTPTVSGDATLTIVVAYRDDFGQTREVRFAHGLKVEKAQTSPTEGEVAAPEAGAPKTFLESVASFFMGLLGLGG
jgi:hypothetical protein